MLWEGAVPINLRMQEANQLERGQKLGRLNDLQLSPRLKNALFWCSGLFLGHWRYILPDERAHNQEGDRIGLGKTFALAIDHVNC